MTAVHLIVTSFQVFSPPTPGPPVSVLLCCFKICMSLRNASHGSKLCVSQPPTWWNDPFKAGSICLNLHSSPLSKASGFGTQPRNILIKAHFTADFLALRRKTRLDQVKPCQRRMDEDSWQKKGGKVRLILTLSLSPCLSTVCVCVFCTVFVCVPRTETDKARGSEWEREREVWEKGEEGYIRKKWKRMDVCLFVWVYAFMHVCIKKLISTWR